MRTPGTNYPIDFRTLSHTDILLRHLEPAHLKEIEGLHRIRDATRDVRKAVALFQEVDKDGSGELDEEEFGFLMETLGKGLHMMGGCWGYGDLMGIVQA